MDKKNAAFKAAFTKEDIKERSRNNFDNSLVFLPVFCVVTTVTELAMRLLPRLEDEQKSYASCQTYFVLVPKLSFEMSA